MSRFYQHLAKFCGGIALLMVLCWLMSFVMVLKYGIFSDNPAATKWGVLLATSWLAGFLAVRSATWAEKEAGKA